MKKSLAILSFAIITGLSSCGGGEQTKETQLADLKKQQTEIQDKITALEKELKASGKAVAVEQKAVPVNVMTVKSEPFNHYLEVQGKVDFDQNVMVSAKVPGVLTSVRVSNGDRVSKGQLLATIESTVLDQSIQELKSGLDLAKTVYQKQKNLWDQKIGTEIQYLTAKNNKESLEMKLATLYQQRDMYNIKAPISGVVDEVMPKAGEAVNPGFGIIRVVNPTGTKIVADISESYTSKIKKGDAAIVFFPDLNKEVPATVKVVSSAINANNRSFTVELGLNNNSGITLNPNMIAVVRINDYKMESATVLPVNVIQKDENSSYVYVAENNGKQQIAKKKTVTTGMTYKDKVEVTEGIAANEKVITTGYQDLNEGQPVTF